MGRGSHQPVVPSSGLQQPGEGGYGQTIAAHAPLRAHRERSTPEPGPLGPSPQHLSDMDSTPLQAKPLPLMPGILERRDSLLSDFSGCGPYPLTPGASAAHPYGLTEKFPQFEVSADFSPFMYGMGMAGVGGALSSASPPPSSTISRASSIDSSTLSPVHAEFPSQQSDTCTTTGGGGGPLSSWSRSLSPLRHAVQSSVSPTETETWARESVFQETQCRSRFPREQEQKAQGSAAHAHPCLWGSHGPCSSGGFATRDELNWHVKLEHLLVCPVLSCTEGAAFGNRHLLDCHVRCAHKSITIPGPQVQPSSSSLVGGGRDIIQTWLSLQQNKEKGKKDSSAAKRQAAEDRRLKMDMSIGISKKKCREQLMNVAEKKYKRANGGTPRAGESPSGITRTRTPRPFESISFPIIWEHGLLPFLVEFIPKWCGPGHVISVTRGKKRDSRRICFMTKQRLSKARKVMIAAHVRDLLPEGYKGTVAYTFSVGEVDRLTWARGLSRQMPDEVCMPRNPFCYVGPCMGDSIGATLADGDDVSATLGPCVLVGGGSYWLANLHPFVEANQGGDQQAIIQHPSPADRDSCLNESHDALDSRIDFQLGKLTATSGFDLKTTRLSHDPYWEEMDKEAPLVVTDWTLISSQTQQANLLRKFPSTVTPKRETPVIKMSSVVPGVEVCSTGRTSGYQRGQVCEIPAYVDGTKSGNGTGKATREWFIEEPHPYDDEDAWIRGGIGVQGDSGAAIVDCETNALIGQLWGRNKYFGPGPRLTFFTPIFDIFDDIQERCGEQTRPQLPQCRNEGNCWPVYPLCRPCFDLREYMESRRSSRESLMSMIPGAGPGPAGDNDHDLTDVSELATPRAELTTPNAAGEMAYWVRHVGAEDIGLSFNSIDSVVSPTPVNAFYYHTQAASPGMPDIRSPYASELNDDDIYGNSNTVLGKRQGPAALVRSVSQQSGKRRRIM